MTEFDEVVITAEVIEAAARVEYEQIWAFLDSDDDEPTSWDTNPSEENKDQWRAQVRNYLTATAPIIERQVREMVAREIEAREEEWALGGDLTKGARLAFEDAARIARKGFENG